MDDDIEMDDEQEQEQEPLEDNEYDDPDEDLDQDEEDDDMDDASANADDDDDDEDDDGSADNDDDDASIAVSRNGTSLRRSTTDNALSAATYLRKVQERRKLFNPPPFCTSTSLGYQIEPMAAAPHGAQIHAMALSLDGQTLLTGGSDGFVRKYDIYATMNGKTMLTQNVRHGFVEGITRGGTLTAFWPNEEYLNSTNTPPSGPEKDRLVGVVHSLAIQQDALWGLSGSESGNIHLFGVRHEPGVTRHVLRKHKGAVSALALTSDEATMISGGWDRGVHQWDLNTGQVVRSFPGHAGQISSLCFRPYPSASAQERRQSSEVISIHPSAVGGDEEGEEEEEDAEDKARNEDAALEAKQNIQDLIGEETAKEGSDEPDSNGITQQEAERKAEDAAKEGESSEKAENEGEKEGDTEKATQSEQADAQPSSSTQPSAPATNSADIPTTTTDPAPSTTTGSTAIQPDPSIPALEPKKEPSDPSAPSSSAAGPGDDPTEEELAFEAELNASLGMSLDGAGAIKADGTRSDAPTATAVGLMVEGADQDDAPEDDLFGGDTPPTTTASTVNKESKTNGHTAGADSDGDDSLFGDGDEDADGDAEGDMDADGDADADADGDGDGEEEDDEGSSDEDMPLAGRVMVKNPSSTSTLAGGISTPIGTASPSLSIALPSAAAPATPAKDAKPADTAPTTTSTPPKKSLPKPAFGGFDLASSYDAPLSTFSPDVMLSTSLSGQVILWDLRCPTSTPSSSDGAAKGVHSLPLPSKIPPWCQSAVFNSSGDKVYVGRRNETIDEWDLRFPTSSFTRSLRLPSGSGPVYSLAPMPNGRHLVTGSYDNIRLWDTEFVPGPGSGGELKVPFKIVAGHHGASLSSVIVDRSCKFLTSASGDRGWMGASTEAVIIHDIKALI